MARDRRQIVLFQSPSQRLTLLFVLVTAGIAFASVQCAAGNYRSAVVVAVASLGAGFLSLAPISIEIVLLAWFATTPLASFFCQVSHRSLDPNFQPRGLRCACIAAAITLGA